jgi:hypothetical protein
MNKHRARTVKQLMDAAMQGEQFPCGTIADHMPICNGTCPRCQERRAIMTKSWRVGRIEASERSALYDDAERRKEYQNAIAAYEQIPAVEPAVSYLVGYASQLH